MKIAFLADPLAQFKIEKDSTYAMMIEASRRGYEVYALEQKDLFIVNNEVRARVAKISLIAEEKKDWFSRDSGKIYPLSHFDAVINRKNPPFDVNYLNLTYFLERAEQNGARVFNRAAALRSHNEKLAITEFPQFIPPTLVSNSADDIRAFYAEHKDIILKPLDGMGGMGIFRVNADGLNLSSIIETLTGNGKRAIMAQKYLPEIVKGDKRILIIDGKAVPYSLARIPQSGEVRGNLAAGGKGVAQELSERDKEIAQTLAPVMKERGLFLVGLDVIGDYVTEINVTSPTCFREITQQTGFNVAGMFLDSLEERIKG